VAGTSGKSTVVAMIFEILRGCRRDPSIITGGELRLLQGEGLLGNAWAGRGKVLVIEADESDGSLTRYAPWAGVLLNMQRDHQEISELAAIFGTFRRNVRGPFLVGEDENLAPFAANATRFGLCEACTVRAQDVLLTPDGARFSIAGVHFTLPVPGKHNVSNAVAALAACQALGLRFSQMAAPLARFEGVARRFQSVGRARGVEVVDDFAHNPDKIAAALSTARARGRRILAVFQPHGFGPTRFLRDDLIAAFTRGLRPTDRLYLPEIYFAGGTVTRDISSRDIAAAVAARGVPALFAERRDDIVSSVAGEAREGDVILVMGARDPSLTDFCQRILARLEARGEGAGGGAGRR
jgi:UDP-N-acetylmuramate--alanine ligase